MWIYRLREVEELVKVNRSQLERLDRELEKLIDTMPQKFVPRQEAESVKRDRRSYGLAVGALIFTALNVLLPYLLHH